MDNLNPPIQEPPLATSVNPVFQPSSSPKQSNNILIIVSVAAIALLLGIGGTYLVLNSKVQKQIQPTPVPTKTQISPTLDETANWKTYTNTKLNFSVRYPETWVFKESSAGSDFAPSENLLSVSQSEIFSPIFIFVKSVDNFDLSTQTLDQYQEKAITVGGINTKRVSGITKQGGQAARRFTGVKMKNNGKTYGIITVGDSYIDIFDQILSTFKFL